MCYSIAPSARILIYMISRTGWQIAPSRLTCGVGGASALRLRALQPVTAPTPRTRAARHGRSERRRRPIAAVAREAVRDPQNRRNTAAHTPGRAGREVKGLKAATMYLPPLHEACTKRASRVTASCTKRSSRQQCRVKFRTSLVKPIVSQRRRRSLSCHAPMIVPLKPCPMLPSPRLANCVLTLCCLPTRRLHARPKMSAQKFLLLLGVGLCSSTSATSRRSPQRRCAMR